MQREDLCGKSLSHTQDRQSCDCSTHDALGSVAAPLAME
jgi:hypothetical protein